jgi:mRNA interferase RelE/StbE
MTALYGLAFAECALRALEGLPIKVRGQVKRRIEALASNPAPPGSKKLHGVMDGEYPVYRVRQGDHRILYSIRNSPKRIIVLDIGHRKDVYK